MQNMLIIPFNRIHLLNWSHAHFNYATVSSNIRLIRPWIFKPETESKEEKGLIKEGHLKVNISDR